MSIIEIRDTSIDTSIDTIISEHINSYLCPEYCIFKIKYLYSKSYLKEFIDKDGPTGDFDPNLKQCVEEKLFEIIPDINLDEKSKKIVMNIVNKNKNVYYPSDNFIKNIFKYYKIPESLFLNWIENINLFKKKAHSFIYLSHQKIYSSNKIFNCVKNNKSLKKNVFECILKTNYLTTVNKCFFRIKYIIYTKINDFFYVDIKSECISEIYHKDIFFKSNITKNNPNLSYKERALYIKNLENQKKVLEYNPVSYFLESIKKLKISYNFLLSSLKYDNDNMSYQVDNSAIKIFDIERLV